MQQKAQGNSPDQLTAGLQEAQWWERECGRVEGSGLRPAQEAAEWERIAELVPAQGWPVYDVALDEQAQAWIAEHQNRVTAQKEQEERVRRARQERAGRVRLQVKLSGSVGRGLRELAGALGVGPERVLAVLAEHAVSGGEGLVHVPAVSVGAEVASGE
ncbi:hypothetical protein [Streptomyces sp. CB03911]|uniref:hypothetical protein n=1 Tax=Streptomyces sp. CB03911 TaxID=1804758 RepID=UPI00093D1A85|nr:hypothetical protein [Streptomyces sp. CB03911]OKI25169.1 hypothetical protein A6A07_31780 [Streptomyces sp. CB03911]